jgi:hypothetical protein
MTNSARTVNQNQRNTLVNNRPRGTLEFGLAFGPLIEDGIVKDQIPPDLFLSIRVYSNTTRLTS